ncbi:hypothetical protein L1887_63186 [Cichorium endivia]|nr:hypothetical protein L1887_63186 [Cichorium endivia]
MEPFPSSAFKFSFEYLLLPPRSAPTARSAQAHAQGFAADRRALLLIGAWHLPRRPGVGRALKRHPFSGLVDSAVLLTKNGPLGALDSVARLNEAAAPSYLFKNSHPGSSYPEGNFGGNQLLDGSISLSPPIPKSDERFARQYRCGPPPEFPLASPRSGIVHHLSVPTGMLTLEPFSEDQGRSAVHPARGIPPISFLAPCGFTHPLTRTHVRLLGPCFKTGRMGCPQAGAGSTQVYRRDGACLPTTIDATASPRAYRQLGLWPPHQSAPVHAPSRSADRLSPFHIRPGRIAGPHSLPSRQFQALFDSLFKGTWARSAAEDASPDYNSDSEAVRFSSWADPGSLAVTKGILVHVHGSFCFAGFDNDPSAGSPTETLLRLLLPLNDKVQWNSRDVAGGEPPTSPRS